MKKIFLFSLICGISTGWSQSWNLLIPASNYNGLELNLSGSGYNRTENKIYSVYWNAQNHLIQSFDLNNQTVQTINAANGPSALNSFTYDFENGKLIAGRSGRDILYSLPMTGGSWVAMGTGSFDSESYGSQYFYNQLNNSVGYFAGYGMYAVKNWVWENDGIQWNNIIGDNSSCDNFTPPKRVSGNPILGDPNHTSLFYFSSSGNCSGSQFDQSCPFGSPWASDVGVWCWLKDIWKYDYANNNFTQIMPPNSPSIGLEGDLAYDYIHNTFYILGGYVPSPVYQPNYTTTYENTVLRYRVGVDNGFLPLSIGGTAPSTYPISQMGTHGAYFDAANDRVVWLRFDGVYSLELGNVGLNNLELNEFKLVPNPSNGHFTIESTNNIHSTKIQISDLSGNIIFESFDGNREFELNNLKNGTYLVKIYSELGDEIIRYVQY
jgi:hypothetical protein